MKTTDIQSLPSLSAFLFADKPSSTSSCLAALRFLTECPDQSPQWSKKCANTIARTDITALPGVLKILDTLANRCPTLFPRVTVKIGEETRQICKLTLTQLSATFAEQLSSEGTTTQTLDLTGNNPDPSIAKAFLEYLASGTLDITAENAHYLFAISVSHGLSSLTQLSAQFITNNLDGDSFSVFYDYAKKSNLRDLLWICYAPIWTVSGGANVSLSLENGVRTVNIKNLDVLTEQSLMDLKSLHASCGIRGLFIEEATSFDSLNFIETLETVRIGSDTYSTTAQIPESWLQTAKHIECKNCLSPATLNAPLAKHIEWSGSSSLITLNASEAIKINCSGSTSLITLNAPKAIKINCSGCTSLKTLDAPSALFVHASKCKSLKTFRVPDKANVFVFSGF